MEIIEGMEIVDFYITDECLYVLERLTELRDNHEYGTLRNIIYDSRNRDEANRRIEIEQEGIIFNENIDIRIYADENVRQILRFLGNAVGFVKIKEYGLMVNMIYREQIREEEKKLFDIKKGLKIINFTNFGEVSRLTLTLRKDLWDKAKEIGSRRGLDKDEFLKLAIIRFLERRYSLVRQALM